MFSIVTLDDDLFEPCAGPGAGGAGYRRVALNQTRARREILIAPHHHETFLGVQLMKLAVHCRRSGIRVVSVGTMNQLPFFAMFSDEVIVAEEEAGGLAGLFTDESSFGFDPAPWTADPRYVDVYRADHPLRVQADLVAADDVVRAYQHPTVHVRRSTWEAFDALRLDDGRIACEIKRPFFPRLYGLLEGLGDPRLLGLDKSFQRALCARVGDHFMGVQVLASVCRGWRFVAAGGAVNLFGVLPVQPLFYLENADDFRPEHQEVARRLAALRYGALPGLLSFPERIHAARALEADDSLDAGGEAVVRAALAAAAAPAPRPEVRLEALARPRGAAGKTFLYARAGWGDREITLERGGRIAGGPGDYEHGWVELGDTLVFTSADGAPRVRLQAVEPAGATTAAGPVDYAGAFIDAGAVRLYDTSGASGGDLVPNSLVLRHGSAIARWVFGYEHDRLFMERNILPWALPDAERVDGRRAADFTIAVYPGAGQVARLADARGTKFLLACEKEARYPKLDGGFSFVQDPRPDDDLSYVRYAPTLCCWCPPVPAPPKSRLCSVVDSGLYDWRRALIRRASEALGEVDVYGGGGRPLAGYHGFEPAHAYGNDKVSGLLPYAFYLSLERSVADDYLTEKLTDAILCECVPLYLGAPNAGRYIDPEAFIPFDDGLGRDWSGWRALYEQKLPAVRAAKEYLRTHLNVFSYFARLIEEPSRLGDVRPI